MAISNYGELKTAVANHLQRRDLDAVIPDFIQNTHLTLTEYTGSLAPLAADTDTNEMLAYDPHTYLFGACFEGAQYLRDAELMATYAARFQQKLQNLAATGFDYIKGTPNGPVI